MSIGTQHEIGATVWHKGEQFTITSGPFVKFGAEWQTAQGKDGREIVVPTTGQAARNQKQGQEEWQTAQEGFRRLRQAATNKER